MTSPIIKKNRRTMDITFKVCVQYASGDYNICDHTVRVWPDRTPPVIGTIEDIAVQSAKEHIENTLINLVSFA